MRILWLKTELLHPIDKGGKIRTYNMLKELKREHHVIYLTLDDEVQNTEARSLAFEYCHELITVPHRQNKKFTAGFYRDLALNLFSPMPYAIKKYESAAMQEKIREQLGRKAFDVLICDFLAPAVNLPGYLPCPTVLFQHNVEAMIWKRHYEVQTNPTRKAYLHGQWTKMRKFEQQMCGRFDTVVAVSREDKDQMKDEYGVARIYDVPTGVDTAYFRPSGRESLSPHSVVFTGSMDWLPNEDAIRYFVEQVMPLVKQSIPDFSLVVVGRDPSSAVVELAQRDRSVVVTGRVEDVRPYIERAAAYIVPLRIGGGTRLKIYEAMAMEKAVISTTIGAEGLALRDGTELLLADTAESFAQTVVRVLSDETLATSLGQQAASKVRESFGWPRAAKYFADFCKQAVNGAQARSLS